MEFIVRTSSESNINKIIALAKRLNVPVEQRLEVPTDDSDKEELKKRILIFKETSPLSFGDPAEWQRNERS